MFVSPVLLLSLVGAALSAPVARQAAPCFVTGSVALPKEVSDGLAGLSGVTCDNSVQVVPGVPDVSSGGVKFSDIDFQKSSLSTLGFSLQTFATPADPATADLALLQNQLNVYLAVEAGSRSQSGTNGITSQVKLPKFFLQFQIARARTALGEQLSVGDTVEHQLGKVIKNAAGASAQEKAQVEALAKQL
ncbi:hypothetical protein PQX77_009214 [Marasmius sp. AFHP31]|nr:hypothetical protein PQX77_009214 [Marasmius sp. AFHP31]